MAKQGIKIPEAPGPNHGPWEPKSSLNWQNPSKDMSCSQKSNFLLVDVCYAWNFVTYFSNRFWMTLTQKTTTSIISIFIFHILATSISRSFHLDSFSTALTDVCRSVWTAISIIWHFLFTWSVTMISGLLATSFSIGVNWYIPQNCCLFLFCNSLLLLSSL